MKLSISVSYTEYLGSCTELPAHHITEMVEQAKAIGYPTFVKHVGKETIDQHFANIFPRLKDDYHVRYYRSKYDGKKCVFVVHSAIEYVFSQT